MSADAQAKSQQGYIEGLEPAICAYCDHFTGHPPEKPHVRLEAARRVHQRCLLGGFHAKPSATCRRWTPKANQPDAPLPEPPPRMAA